MRELLSKREREILVLMRDQDEELVHEAGETWVGTERVSGRLMFSLLRMTAISMDSLSEVGGFERYHINETGRKLLEG